MKKLTLSELMSSYTAEEFKELISQKDEKQSRAITARELNTTPYILRKAAAEAGIIRKQGKPKKVLKFKEEK